MSNRECPMMNEAGWKPVFHIGGGRLVEASLPRAGGVLLLVGLVAEFAEVGIVALGGEEVGVDLGVDEGVVGAELGPGAAGDVG